MFAGIVCALAVAGFQAGSVLPNGGFEESDGQNLAGWETRNWGGVGAHGWYQGRTGGRSVTIGSETGGDLSWSIRVPVEQNRTYRLSGWIRTNNVQAGTGRGALLNVHQFAQAQTRAITGTTDWTEVSTTFRSGSAREVMVNCLFGGWGQSTGTAWFDDIKLEAVSGPNQNPTAEILAAREGEPISPFIYSQFLEHLGRCIYGGIWAEMLEDRKFFFPITENYNPYGRQDPEAVEYPILQASPWRVAQGGVKHRERIDYRRQPVLALEANTTLEQRWLGIEEGREYSLRVVASGKKNSRVKVRLRSLDGRSENSFTFSLSGSEFKVYTAKLTGTFTSVKGIFDIACDAPVEVAAVSLMPSDNIQGFRADTLALLKRLNAPLYRWPGGNFVSGYEWRDGVGDPDRRPTRRNPAWTGIDTNDVGTHEFVQFCKLVNTEPLIVVNTGFGDPNSAKEWVEYCNGAGSTYQGGQRAKNGAKEPFGIVWWGVGNEMYGDWQLGHMSIQNYTVKHNLTVDAMREVDKNLKLVAVGESAGYVPNSSWSAEMLKASSSRMTLLSEHFYVQTSPSVEDHLFAPVNAIRRKAEAHRKLLEQIPAARRARIKVAMDEWNYWYGPHVYGELGTQYFQKDGLGIAAGLHEFFRNSDVYEMANYAQAVNVIGAIKTSKTRANMETTGLALELYRREFGTIPVSVQGDFEAQGVDVMAAFTADRKALTVGIVNGQSQPVNLNLSLAGPNFTLNNLTGWVIAASDPLAHNTPVQPEVIKIVPRKFDSISPVLKVDPLSITVIRVPVR